MNILVTGANGFVGTHLCKKLLDQGHIVYGLVRNPSKMMISHPRFFPIQGDFIIKSPALCLSWVNDLPDVLDACVHTAGLVHSFDPHHFFQVNVEGTRMLIHSLKIRYASHSLNSIFKFILISSLASAGSSAFGEKKTEIEPDFPVSQYGLSKKQAETILLELAPKEWITSIVRPPMIIGPGDMAVLDIFKMVKSRLIILPGINSKIKEYSFVCVFDLVETITLILASPKPLFLYSSFDHVITFQELINTIKKRMKIRFLFYLPIPLILVYFIGQLLARIHKFFPHDLRLTPDKIYELKGEAWTCDNTQSKTTLAQNYQYSLQETIKITYEDYQHRGWL